MITNAIGKPTTKAPPIIDANAESKLSSAWTSRLDIPSLHQAPTSTARRPMPSRCKAVSLWLRKSKRHVPVAMKMKKTLRGRRIVAPRQPTIVGKSAPKALPALNRSLRERRVLGLYFTQRR
jgi:hypothetical protein